MLNPDPTRQTAAEAMSQVSSYFQAVDNAVLMGDTNKRYRPSTNGCYAPSVPVHANSYATVIISPSFDNTADLWNSYIYAEFEVKISISRAITTKWDAHGTPSAKSPYRTWVGFKDAFDAIEKYEIVSNGITKYTQNFSPEESFITNAANLEIIKKTDVYSKARHKEVWRNKYYDKCGCILDWDPKQDGKEDNMSQTAKFKLKIDIRRFLPLSNIKYLPAFAGKLELRLMFGTAGMVVAPINPFAVWQDWCSPAFYNHPDIQLPSITNEFLPIGVEFKMLVQCTAKGNTPVGEEEEVLEASPEEEDVGVKENSQIDTVLTGMRTLTADASSLVINRLDTTIYCFGIADQLYQGLLSRYTQMTLTFPTQILNIASMSNVMRGSTNPKSTQTITPRFIDTLFLLFPLNGRYRTCYKNPGFSQFYITCGGFGQYPDIPYGTLQEPRLIEMIQNAINLNSNSVGINEEVLNSLTALDGKQLPSNGWVSRDKTDFFIGIPFETDGTFQQGMTSATPINFELHVTQPDSGEYYAKVDRPPLICLLQDATISIQVMPDGSPSLVEVGPFDITSPVAG
jgi:hypothetical protein